MLITSGFRNRENAMPIELLPALQVQRDLNAMPRDRNRFQKYLEAMMGDTGDVVPPITGAHLMGKLHCLAKADELLHWVPST
jgi:hypothetical protein